MRIQIVVLLSIWGCSQAIRPMMGDILEMVKVSENVVYDVVEIFKFLDVELPPEHNAQKVLIEWRSFYNYINKSNAQMEGEGSMVVKLLQDVGVPTGRLHFKLEDANEKIKFIHLKYKHMGSLKNSTEAYKFAKSIVSQNERSLQTALDIFHSIIVPVQQGVQSVFKILEEYMKVQGNKIFCSMRMSAQQLLFKLYNKLALTELQGFLLKGFSYLIIKAHNKGNFTMEIEPAQRQYEIWSAITLNLTIDTFGLVPTELWKCDPYKHVKNETYIEITELLQGYIENEEELNRVRSCERTCNDFTFTKSYNCHDYLKDVFCNKNRQCKGNIINCHLIADDTVCLADAGTNRRYEFIKPPHKRSGRWKDCANNTASFKMWWYGAFKCEYCMCLCDEQGVNSDRYFSLLRSESNIDDNMVITGLRFVKKNRIIHLQIQEGKLLPMTKINVSTVRWIPVEDFGIESVSDGHYYHTLTWEKRGINFDDIIRYEEEVVTGVSFNVFASRLQLMVRMTPFDFTTGTLKVRNSTWWHNRNKDRKKLNLDNKDNPIAYPLVEPVFPSLPLSKPDMSYLEFTHSDFDLDVAQTTVPFLDAQAVTLAEPVPLSGAGLLYKSSNISGGFITPKIMTYDYTNVLIEAYNDMIYEENTKENSSIIRLPD